MQTKKCKICQEEKPLTNFPLRSRQQGQIRQNICRGCARRNYTNQGLCRCGGQLVRKTMCQTCLDRKKRNSKDQAVRLKKEVINHYGGKCRFCGEDEIIFLAIDHLDDNGSEHRRQQNIQAGEKTYRWLKKNGFPDGFQTLCHNCNIGKQLIGTEELIKLRKK